MFIYRKDLERTLMSLSRSWRKAKHSNLVSKLPFSIPMSTNLAFEHHKSAVDYFMNCDGFFNTASQR